MLILADHHQKLIYTRAHLLPPSSPSGNDDQKSNPTFFSNMQKVHKKTDVCLGLTKLSLPTLAAVTWLSRLRCWFYARLGVTFVTSQIKGWCFDISAWLTKWNPQSQFRSTMMERIFFSDPNMFRKVMSKHSDRRKVVKRSTTDYQANLLIVIAICTWIGWTLDEQQQNKISYT